MGTEALREKLQMKKDYALPASKLIQKQVKKSTGNNTDVDQWKGNNQNWA